MDILRRSRTAVLGTAVGTALLGALTAPAGVTLLGAPLVGAVAAAVVLVVAWGTDSPRPSPRALWLAASAGAIGVPFGFGLSLLGSPGAVLLVLLLPLGAVRPAERTSTPGGSAAHR